MSQTAEKKQIDGQGGSIPVDTKKIRELLRAFGLRVFYGDGTRPDLLKAAHIEDVKMVVIAIDEKEKIQRDIEK